MADLSSHDDVQVLTFFHADTDAYLTPVEVLTSPVPASFSSLGTGHKRIS